MLAQGKVSMLQVGHLQKNCRTKVEQANMVKNVEKTLL